MIPRSARSRRAYWVSCCIAHCACDVRIGEVRVESVLSRLHRATCVLLDLPGASFRNLPKDRRERGLRLFTLVPGILDGLFECRLVLPRVAETRERRSRLVFRTMNLAGERLQFRGDLLASRLFRGRIGRGFFALGLLAFVLSGGFAL